MVTASLLTDYLKLIKHFVLVAGPTAAGKTSILQRLKTGTFKPTLPTAGYHEDTINGVKVVEIAGHETYQQRYLRDVLQQHPMVIFFVVDVTRPPDVTAYHDFMRMLARDDAPEDQAMTKKVVVLVNKMDLVDNDLSRVPPALKEATREHVGTDDRRHNVIIPCSAKTGMGMMDILEVMGEAAAAARQREVEARRSRRKQPDTVPEQQKEKIARLLKKYEDLFK